MNNRALAVVRSGLILAALLLLYESLLGCIYVLGIGFSTAHDVLTDLCVTMAFPVFLIGLRSVRGSAVGLWIFFVIQWIDICSNKRPPGFVNPLAWLHGDLLLIAAALVTISVLLLSKAPDGKKRINLREVFSAI